MTGYGRGESIGFDWKCTAEFKAVNHRYCDISIRMPAMMNPYEDRIRKMLSLDIHRGKVEVYIRIESFGQQPLKIDINAGAADAYMAAFRLLLDRYGMQDQVTLDMLSSRPEVFMVDKTVTDETLSRVWEVLEKALQDALVQFNGMRRTEGKALQEDIKAKRIRLAGFISELKERLPEAAQDYEKRLRDRIAEVIAQAFASQNASPAGSPGFFPVPDESRMLVELALYADKVCVDEEIIRLESHLKQMDHIMSEKEAVGRKLDFLVQELNREVNTIGSKSGDIIVSKLVIDMKSEIEKIREQVQNVE